MKVLKRTEQRNLNIHSYCFTIEELSNLIKKYELFAFSDDGTIFSCNNVFSADINLFSLKWRISLEKCNEVKVVYSEVYEQYISVVVTNDGVIIPVEL